MVDGVATSVLIVDIDVVEENIPRIANECRGHGINSRPHDHARPVSSPGLARLPTPAG